MLKADGMHHIHKKQPELQPVVVQRKFIGGLIQWMLPKLPKAFRKFMEAHQDEPIKSITVYRSPLDHLATGAINVLTAGNWEDIKHKAGMDKLFHVYMIINNKYTYEKESVPKIGPVKDADFRRPNAEALQIPVRRSLKMGDFIGNAEKEMGEKYYKYDAWENNCQDFLLGSLKGSGLVTPAASSFLKQDIKKLVEETPSLSKYLGRELTDLAGAAEKLYSEVVDKRGGIRHQTFQHGKRKHIGHHYDIGGRIIF